MFYFPAMATQCLQWVGENLEFLLTRMVLTLMLPGDGDSDADIFIRGGDGDGDIYKRGGDGSTEESSHIKSSSQGPSNKHPHPSPPHSSWPGLQLIFQMFPSCTRDHQNNINSAKSRRMTIEKQGKCNRKSNKQNKLAAVTSLYTEYNRLCKRMTLWSFHQKLFIENTLPSLLLLSFRKIFSLQNNLWCYLSNCPCSFENL